MYSFQMFYCICTHSTSVLDPPLPLSTTKDPYVIMCDAGFLNGFVAAVVELRKICIAVSKRYFFLILLLLLVEMLCFSIQQQLLVIYWLRSRLLWRQTAGTCLAFLLQENYPNKGQFSALNSGYAQSLRTRLSFISNSLQ